jgi:hypothetical protein
MIVLYLGPDSLLPLGSIIAAVVGFALLFWNRIVGAARKATGRGKDADPDAAASDPASTQPPDNQGL